MLANSPKQQESIQSTFVETIDRLSDVLTDGIDFPLMYQKVKLHAAFLDLRSTDDLKVQEQSKRVIEEYSSRNGENVHSMLDVVRLLENPKWRLQFLFKETEQKSLLRLAKAIYIFQTMGNPDVSSTAQLIDGPTYSPFKFMTINSNLNGIIFNLSVRTAIPNEVANPSEPVFFSYDYAHIYQLSLIESLDISQHEMHGFYFHGENHQTKEERVAAIKRLADTFCAIWNQCVERNQLHWFLQQLMSGPCIEGATRKVFAIFAAVEALQATLASDQIFLPATEQAVLNFYHGMAESFADFLYMPKTTFVMSKLIADVYAKNNYLAHSSEMDEVNQSWQVVPLTEEKIQFYIESLGIYDEQPTTDEIKKFEERIKELSFQEAADLIDKLEPYTKFFDEKCENCFWQHPYFKTFLKYGESMPRNQIDAQDFVRFLCDIDYIDNFYNKKLNFITHAVLCDREDVVQSLLECEKFIEILDEDYFENYMLPGCEENEVFLKLIDYVGNNLSDINIEKIIDNIDIFSLYKIYVDFLNNLLEKEKFSNKFFSFIKEMNVDEIFEIKKKDESFLCKLISSCSPSAILLAGKFLHHLPRLAVYFVELFSSKIGVLSSLFGMYPIEQSVEFFEKIIDSQPSLLAIINDNLFDVEDDSHMPIIFDFFHCPRGLKLFEKIIENEPKNIKKITQKVFCQLDNDTNLTSPLLFHCCASKEGRELFLTMLTLDAVHMTSLVTSEALALLIDNKQEGKKSAAACLLEAQDEASQNIIKILLYYKPELGSVLSKNIFFSTANQGFFAENKKRERDDSDPDESAVMHLAKRSAIGF